MLHSSRCTPESFHIFRGGEGVRGEALCASHKEPDDTKQKKNTNMIRTMLASCFWPDQLIRKSRQPSKESFTGTIVGQIKV